MITTQDNFMGQNPGIVGKGDSMMQGPGVGESLIDHLRRLMSYRDFKNLGIGGQSWEQIFARHGSEPVYVTLTGGAMNNATDVNLTIAPQLSSTPADTSVRNLTGTVNGVPVIVKRTVVSTVETYKISSAGMPTTTAIPDKSLFIPDEGFSTRGLINLFWLGRNNSAPWTGLLDAYERAADYLYSPKRFLAIGILPKYAEANGTADRIALNSFNSALQAKYGNRYISVDAPTLAELSAVGYTPLSQDLTDIAAGLFPTGLRNVDGTHLLSLGYKIMANRCAAALNKYGW